MTEIPTTCQFRTYGYKCGKPVEHGHLFCKRHKQAKCASCGQPATHERCDYCGQFVCVAPLCDERTYGTDESKPQPGLADLQVAQDGRNGDGCMSITRNSNGESTMNIDDLTVVNEKQVTRSIPDDFVEALAESYTFYFDDGRTYTPEPHEREMLVDFGNEIIAEYERRT